MPSLNLTSLQLQSVVESLSSNLCFLYSMFVASIAKRDRFQLWSFQLTTAQLCSSAANSLESLQQKELEAASPVEIFSRKSFQDSPREGLQQKELQLRSLRFGNAWLKASKRECSTRASQLQLDAFRTGALQEFAATAFQDPGTAAYSTSSSSSLQYSISSI